MCPAFGALFSSLEISILLLLRTCRTRDVGLSSTAFPFPIAVNEELKTILFLRDSTDSSQNAFVSPSGAISMFKYNCNSFFIHNVHCHQISVVIPITDVGSSTGPTVSAVHVCA